MQIMTHCWNNAGSAVTGSSFRTVVTAAAAFKVCAFLVVTCCCAFTYARGPSLEFTVEPSDTIVEAGQSAVLDCKAHNGAHQQPGILIEWLDGDYQKIIFDVDQYRSQLTNGSMYFSSVLEEQRLTGSYQCIASLHNIGSIISRSAKLEIGRIAGFLMEPSDISVYKGQKAYFACLVDANPAPRIRWLKDERPLQIDQVRMIVLPSGALEIDDVQESDQGSYRCNASGLNSYKLSNKATLIVNGDGVGGGSSSGGGGAGGNGDGVGGGQPNALLHAAQHHTVPPNFIAKPQSTIAVEGQNVSLDCAANGYPVPRIKWLKDGHPIDMDDLDSRFQLIESTNSLRITNVKEFDAGTYQCRAANSEDSVDATATLDVQVPPRFVVRPQDRIEAERTDMEWECAAYGKPKPQIQWYKNAELIHSSDYYQITKAGNLRIVGLIAGDSALFQCLASNAAGNVQTVAHLKVNTTDAPTKIAKKTGKRKKKLPMGKQQHSQQLLRKSQWDNRGSAPTLGVVDFSHLTKSTHHRNHDQHHQHDGNGSQESGDDDGGGDGGDGGGGGGGSDGDMSVNYLHDVRHHPNNPSQFSAYDPHTVFTALKSSDSSNSNSPTREHQFLQPVTHNSDHTFANSDFDSLLSFPDLHTASTDDGEDQRIKGFPGPPRDLEALIVKARFVILSWKPPEFNANGIHTYTVYYRQDGSERERIQNTSRSRLEEMNVGALTPGRTYYFRVVAINHIGMGASSDTLKVQMQSEEHVASSPRNFQAYATSARSIHVSWEPPELPNGVLQRYTIYYMETTSSSESTIDTEKLKYDLVGLSVYTEYSIWVVAVNENGPGAATQEKIVRTLSTSPSEPPQNITLEASSTSLVVRWEPPPVEFQNGPITGYKLRYRKKGKNQSQTITTAANERWFAISDLERAATYQLKLWAMNVNGTSPSTDWIEIETFANDLDESRVPEKPGPLRIRPTYDKLYVVWSAPMANTKVRNYVLGWGKGVPDMYMHTVDEKTRNFIIERLDPNSEYVLSLRASNAMGAGPPVYATVRTQDEPPPEPQPPLIPPVGLKAQIFGPTSVVLYWSDNSKGKAKDNRYYVVKYTDEKAGRSHYINTSDAYAMLADLKPNTMYEFTVKLVKGYKESPWSMVVQNTTWEQPPSTAPRDIRIRILEDPDQEYSFENGHGNKDGYLEISWQPPRVVSGRINGYVILYTDNRTMDDRHWLAASVKGNKTRAFISNLKPFTEYHFKVQARNSRGAGPFSSIAAFKTGQVSRSVFSNSVLLYLLVSGCVLSILTVSLVAGVLCCRRRKEGDGGPCGSGGAANGGSSLNMSPSNGKKTHQKSSSNSVKQPPDLWIHHDQMELKAMEKSQSNIDGASVSGMDSALSSLPRSMATATMNDDYETNSHLIHEQTANSMDKHTYISGYMGASLDHDLHDMSDGTNSRKSLIGRSRPIIMLPLESKPPRESISTPINGPLVVPCGGSGGDGTNRPAYPRTQLNMSRGVGNLHHTATLHATPLDSPNSPLISSQHQQVHHIPISSTPTDGTLPMDNPYAFHQQHLGHFVPSHLHQNCTGTLSNNSTCQLLSSGAISWSASPSDNTNTNTGSSMCSSSNTSNSSASYGTHHHHHHTNLIAMVQPPGGTTCADPNKRPPVPSSAHQQHPLKSFSVPAPPPPPMLLTPTAPNTAVQPSKNIITLRSNTSPFKKTLSTLPSSRINQFDPPPHTPEEIQRLKPSQSTEELNQEMANLEGLMLTLNAITTTNEFEC